MVHLLSLKGELRYYHNYLTVESPEVLVSHVFVQLIIMSSRRILTGDLLEPIIEEISR